MQSYNDLTAAIGNWLDHSIFAPRYGDFVALFEAKANRTLRVRQMEATTILVPSNPTPVTITGAAADGGGVIQLTVISTSTLITGQEYNVASVNGTTEANGSWIVTVKDGTHVNLNGSTFVNAYVSGGTITSQSGYATIPSDYLAWRRVTWTGQTRIELGFVHPSYLQAAYPSQPSDVPRIFTIEGSTLKVMPLNFTPLEFDYYQQIPALATASPGDGTQTNWLMTAHPDLYLFGAMAEAEAFGVNDERMPMWKARRDDIFEEIIRLNNQTRGPSCIRVFGPTP
jgi:hypothetical protein